MFERWNDGALETVVRAQRICEERADQALGSEHVLQGVLETPCGAQGVLERFGLTEMCGPVRPTLVAAAGGSHHRHREFLAALSVAARVEATVRRDTVITSCHVAIAALDPAMTAHVAAAGEARLAGAMRPLGLDAETISRALRAHLDEAIPALVALAADVGA